MIIMLNAQYTFSILSSNSSALQRRDVAKRVETGTVLGELVRGNRESADLAGPTKRPVL